MLDLAQALEVLRLDILKIAQLEKDRLDLLNSPLNAAMKDERDRELKEEIGKRRSWTTRVLIDLATFPPHHAKHSQQLEEFKKAGGFEKSVFIMTKFPDPKKPAPVDAQLDKVIRVVCDAVSACNFKPRLASEKHYYGDLWDNVELYLLGCCRGIAIVEEKYLPELNPNVAMEWGWMRGMGRSVLYLVEKDFKKYRADWGGLIESTFDWNRPEEDIPGHVQHWLNTHG